MRVVLVLLMAFLILPLAVQAEVAETYQIESAPKTGLASNAAIDIIAHGSDSTGVWLATPNGLSFSFDGGLSWFAYRSENGLPANNLSAIYSIDGRIWVASNSEELLGGELFSISEGLTYSDDDGLNWNRLNFGSGGLNIPRVEGGDRTIFDITGHADQGYLNHRVGDQDVDWLFFAAFAGGLLASQDGGINWRRIYPSVADSIQFNSTTEAPSLKNRYFSCVADTSHGDSLFLWTGTAAGVVQYVFAPPSEKLFTRGINAVAFSDTAQVNGLSRLFVGGNQCMSVTDAKGSSFSSRFFSLDGLPGHSITAMIDLGDNLLAGSVDTLTGQSAGLAVSHDQGDSFTPVAGIVPAVSGTDREILDFELQSDRLYMAAHQAGLFVSADSGSNWAQILIDSSVAASQINSVNTAFAFADTLVVGTDSGLVELFLNPSGDIDSMRHTDFLETDSSSARIIKAKVQLFPDSTGADSTVLWTIHRPMTAGGAEMVGRRSPDGGTPVWSFLQQGVTNYDVNFFGDTAFVVGEGGIGFTTRGEEPTNRFSAREYVNDSLVVATLDIDTVTVMEVKADTVVFGTLRGVAISTDRGQQFKISRANQDSLKADTTVNYTILSTIAGLNGDFIVALGTRYMSSGPAQIFASARPVTFGVNGMSYGQFEAYTDSVGDTAGYFLHWNTIYDRDIVWNLEFDTGSVIYAATNEGLLVNNTPLDSLNTIWDRIDFVDQTSGEQLVAPGTAVFGVGIVDSLLWAGTDDGTISIRLDDPGSQRLHQRVDSTTSADEVYAFPTPFRPYAGQQVDFHFVVDQAGAVTLEIYDFAMNLVARPIDGVSYSAGIYPEGSSQGRSWDGRNGKGNIVASGIYYFKVTLPSGEERWGKLAVIP